MRRETNAKDLTPIPDFVHPTRTGQAILANAILHLFQTTAYLDPDQKPYLLWRQAEGEGFLDLEAEKGKDPWRPGRFSEDATQVDGGGP